MPKVKLGDVATECRDVCKHEKEKLPAVGLEHLTPGEIRLSSWSETADNTFSKAFRKGSMLFGRRRAYLKKAALAPFDGICSGDITVIEAFPDKLLPELLPFVIQNDAFFDYAVGRSAGSLSPRVKWEYLRNYTFSIPDIDQQRELTDILWAAENTREAYQHLLMQTDELVKSQFIEMFGDPAFNPMGWRKTALINLCKDPDDIKCGPFGTQLAKGEYKSEGIPLWGIPQVNSAFSIPTIDYLTEEKAQNLSAYSAMPGDIVMSRKGNVGMCALYPSNFPLGIIHSDVLRIRVDQSIADPHFLMCQLHFSQDVQNQIANVSNGVIMAGVNVTKLKNITVLLPDIDVQMKFVAFVEQSDISKSELKQAIESISALIKSLMQQDFSNIQKEGM